MLAAACDIGPESEPTVCTLQVEVSVVVTVHDDAGVPLSDAAVTFTGAGGTEGDCAGGGDGEYYCGEDIDGELTVRVVAAGFEEASETIVVEAGECHVVTETLVFDLTPSA
jgi:hypothetical protein